MSTPAPTVTALLALGQPMFAEALADALADHRGIDVVDARPRSTGELVDVVAAHQPDVVLVDYHLDVTPPAQVVAAVCERQPDTRVLVLSSRHDEEVIEGLLDAGGRLSAHQL